MDRPDYIVHEAEYRGDKVLAKRNTSRIVIMGAGALGSWVTDILSRQGYHALAVADFDTVERGNLGTQNFGPSDVGKKKATQVAFNTYRRIGVKVEPIDTRVTASNIQKLIKNAALVVDVFDNVPSRKLVQDVCGTKIPCVHAGLGSIGFYEIKWNEVYAPRSAGENPEDAPCDYPLAVNLVLLCAAATCEVIDQFIDSGIKNNVEYWLTKFISEKV